MRFNSLFESGFRWRLFWDLNPCYFSQLTNFILCFSDVGFHNQRNKEPLNTFLYACKAQAPYCHHNT
nr:MAG TPA: hypothetical protein [Caudoviricetes sp.]